MIQLSRHKSLWCYACKWCDSLITYAFDNKWKKTARSDLLCYLMDWIGRKKLRRIFAEQPKSVLQSSRPIHLCTSGVSAVCTKYFAFVFVFFFLHFIFGFCSIFGLQVIHIAISKFCIFFHSLNVTSAVVIKYSDNEFCFTGKKKKNEII